MSTFGTFELTHPEMLTEDELREILKSRCIDFSQYEKSSRSELLELYKRVALPLPQRKNESNLDKESQEEKSNSPSKSHNNSVSSSCTTNLKRNMSDKTIHISNLKGPKSTMDEYNHRSKKICLSNSREGALSNGIHKRNYDGKQDESPSKKRQKITWP